MVFLQAQDQDVTAEEIEKAQRIRESLIERGLLYNNSAISTAEVTASANVKLDNAWYTERRKSLAPDNSGATEFKSDGSRFYVVGRSQLKVFEYRLSSDWNINSANLQRELDISDEMGSGVQSSQAPFGIYIRKSDGEKMWIWNRTEIWEYELSTPWNVSTASLEDYKDFSDVITRGHDIDFKPDGSVLYVDDRIIGAVFQFELPSSWNIESIDLDDYEALDISDRQKAVRGTQLTSDGRSMLLMDTGRQEILEYSLSSPFDVTTGSFVGTLSVKAQAPSPEGVTFKPDFEHFYVTNTNNNNVYQYKISTIDADVSSVSESREKVIANGSATSRITVVARDDDGDRIIGRDISLSSNGSSVDINEIRGTTNSDGEAIFEVSNTDEEIVDFTASGDGTDIDEKATVFFVTVDEDESTVASNKEKVLANGDAVGIITVTARDADGDRLADAPIELDANSGDVDIDDPTKTTDSFGEATFEVSNDEAETVVFTAEGMGNTIEETTSIRFVTVNAEESSVSSNDKKVIANGKQSGRVSVTARDSDGDVLKGVSINLNSNSSSVDIESVNKTTDSDGIARFDITNTTIETVEFEARGLGVEIDEEATIRFTGVDADESSISVNRTKVLANGSAFSTVTVIARDVDEDILEGVEVSVEANGGSSKIQNVQAKTDKDGVATFRVTNEIAEAVEYSARGMGITLSESVIVDFVTGDPEESSVAAGTTQVEANGDETSTITVTARDEDGDILQGVEIELTSNEENVKIDELNEITDDEGRVRYRVSSETAGRVRFTATAIRKADDVEIEQKALVEFIPVAPVSLAATNVETDRFRANWELVRGAGSYLIDISTDTTFNFFVNNYNSLDVGFKTEFTVTNLEPGTIYYYRVRAAEDDLIGANSDPIQVETFPEVPVALSPESRGVTRFSATWESAPGAQSYLLDIASDENFNNFVPGFKNLEVGNTLSQNVTGLFPGTTYYYRVRSMSFTRVSSLSEVVETRTVEIGREESNLSSSQLRVLANGEQENFITVVLRDTEGRPLDSEEISLKTDHQSSVIEPVEPSTNEEGEATFAVTNTQSGEVTYRAFISGTSFEVGTINVEFLDAEGRLELGNNYPNPFNQVTTIPVTIPESMNVRIVITNVLGATVKQLIDEELNTGYYEIKADLRDLASGIYFYRLITEDKVDTKKMLLVQ